MKVGILAGGRGSRLAEETGTRPKPMVEIGGRPILWHIMQHYSSHGFHDFVIALGYQGQIIKRYMVDLCQTAGDLTVDLRARTVTNTGDSERTWKVELVETGDATMTGGRIKRLARHFEDRTFMLTWGDAVSDINLDELLSFHRAHGKLATLTAVRPPARFGHLRFEGNRVVEFDEKPEGAAGWIQGAYFVLEPGIFDYIDGDSTQWERGPLQRLARDGELFAFKHESFWQCMDTLPEKQLLDRLWNSGEAPWKTWG